MVKTSSSTYSFALMFYSPVPIVNMCLDQSGFVPLLIGDGAKIALVTLLLPTGWKLLYKSRN